jgi:acyl-CoA thioesterase-1
MAGLAATEVSFMWPGAGVRSDAAPRSYGKRPGKVQRRMGGLYRTLHSPKAPHPRPLPTIRCANRRRGAERPRSWIASFLNLVSCGETLRRVLAIGLFAIVWAAVALPAGVAGAAERPIKIVALGDSLTAGYQLPADAAFPAQLERALKAKGLAAEIVNAGVSGDTSSGGLARLDWSVPDGTDAVILELGANDMLRGIDPKVTRDALDQIVSRLKARRIEVLLCGMRASRNLGSDYARAFDAIYPKLAAGNDLVFYPFFLDGVFGDAKLSQNDGLHPTAAGVAAIVARILPKAEALLARVRAKPAS